jgi:hypothetical protein
MLLVTCNTCGAQGFTLNGRYPDVAVECECCPEGHDHGKSANETGVICRPVTITVVPGSQSLRMG